MGVVVEQLRMLSEERIETTVRYGGGVGRVGTVHAGQGVFWKTITFNLSRFPIVSKEFSYANHSTRT